MNYLRSKLPRGSRGQTGSGDAGGPHLTIAPGAVEEAVHFMQFTGDIDLSELTFTAESPGHDSPGIESFLDVAVFEVPAHCTSHNCDLSQFGVGALTHFNGATFLNLCQAGRLMIDKNKFQGHHTQLMIPREEPMPNHIKRGSGIFKVPVQNRNYDVMLANCNDNGRPVQLGGQVVFDFDDSFTTPITARSLTILTAVAFAVCLLLSILSIKVDRGTRSDWEYQRFQNVEVEREEQERERLRGNDDNGDETDQNEDHESDEEDELEEMELRPVTIA